MSETIAVYSGNFFNVCVCLTTSPVLCAQDNLLNTLRLSLILRCQQFRANFELDSSIGRYSSIVTIHHHVLHMRLAPPPVISNATYLHGQNLFVSSFLDLHLLYSSQSTCNMTHKHTPKHTHTLKHTGTPKHTRKK